MGKRDWRSWQTTGGFSMLLVFDVKSGDWIIPWIVRWPFFCCNSPIIYKFIARCQPDFRYSGILLFRLSGKQAFLVSGFQEKQISGKEGFRFSWFQEKMIPCFQVFMKTGYQAFRISGKQGFGFSWFQVLGVLLEVFGEGKFDDFIVFDIKLRGIDFNFPD